MLRDCLRARLVVFVLLVALGATSPGCGDTPAPGSVTAPEDVVKRLQDPKPITIPKKGVKPPARPGRR
jgi:hypothetical protein